MASCWASSASWGASPDISTPSTRWHVRMKKRCTSPTNSAIASTRSCCSKGLARKFGHLPDLADMAGMRLDVVRVTVEPLIAIQRTQYGVRREVAAQIVVGGEGELQRPLARGQERRH